MSRLPKLAAVATLRPVQTEIASPRNGKPSYRWVPAYEVTTPAGTVMAPYMRPREARRFCRERGWATRVVQP